MNGLFDYLKNLLGGGSASGQNSQPMQSVAAPSQQNLSQPINAFPGHQETQTQDPSAQMKFVPQQTAPQQNNMVQGLHDYLFSNAAKAQAFVQSPQQLNIANRIQDAVIPQLAPQKEDSTLSSIAKGILHLPANVIDTFGNYAYGTGSDIGRLAGNALTNQDIPDYASLKSPATRLAYNAMGIQQNPQQVIGNIAGVSTPIIAAGAGNVINPKNAADTVLGRIAQGATSGAIGGAEYGGAQGLSDSRNAPTFKDQAISAAFQAVQNGIAGAIAGGAISGGKEMATEAKDILASQNAQAGGMQLGDNNKTLTQLDFDNAKKAYLGGNMKAEEEMQSSGERLKGENDVANFEDAYHQGNFAIARQIANDSKSPVLLQLAAKLPQPTGNPAESGYINFGAKVGGDGQNTPPPDENSGNGEGSGVENPTDPYFNVKRINAGEEGQAQLAQTVEEIKPQIQQYTGTGPLSNDQAMQFAENTSKVLKQTVGKDDTLAWEASMLKARQNLAASAQSGTVDQNYIDNLLTIKSQSTDIARKLQSLSINADPATQTYKDAIVEAVLKTGAQADDVLQAAQGVDMNDPKQATAFYRQFVKPSFGDWVDTVRFSSMLSNPKTLFNIGISNALNTSVVAPVQKTVAGALDTGVSALTGKEQTHFMGEGPAYVAGYVGATKDAVTNFVGALQGNVDTNVPDLNRLPLATEGASGAAYNTLSFPTKLHNALYQFFTTLAQGGEEKSLQYRADQGVDVGNIETQAADNAKYSTFRQGVNNPGQGPVLGMIDQVVSAMDKLKYSDNPVASTVFKFAFPFLHIAENQFKQGVEYSPVGFATVPGSSDPIAQTSKALMGTTALALTAVALKSGNVTWAMPTNPKEKNAFIAAGMQPYSIKIGNTWYAYNKLPPALGYPMAIASALEFAYDHRNITQNAFDAGVIGLAKSTQYFADQSYVKNISDVISGIENPESRANAIAGYPQQLIPYRALFGWLARLTDPYQRQYNTNTGMIGQQIQSFMSQIPGLSEQLPARTDLYGQPIASQDYLNPLKDVNPLNPTVENPQEKQLYDILEQHKQLTANINATKKLWKAGQSVSPQLIMTPQMQDQYPNLASSGVNPDAAAQLQGTGYYANQGQAPSVVHHGPSGIAPAGTLQAQPGGSVAPGASPRIGAGIVPGSGTGVTMTHNGETVTQGQDNQTQQNPSQQTSGGSGRSGTSRGTSIRKPSLRSGSSHIRTHEVPKEKGKVLSFKPAKHPGHAPIQKAINVQHLVLGSHKPYQPII